MADYLPYFFFLSCPRDVSIIAYYFTLIFKKILKVGKISMHTNHEAEKKKKNKKTLQTKIEKLAVLVTI